MVLPLRYKRVAVITAFIVHTTRYYGIRKTAARSVAFGPLRVYRIITLMINNDYLLRLRDGSRIPYTVPGYYPPPGRDDDDHILGWWCKITVVFCRTFRPVKGTP